MARQTGGDRRRAGTRSTSLLGLGVWAAVGWESPCCFPRTQGHAFPGRRAHGRGTVGRWTLPGRAQAVPGLPQGSTCLASKGLFLSISRVSSETAPDRCREPDLERQGDEVRNTTKTLGVGWGSSFGELLLLSVGLDVLGGCRQRSSPVRACSRPSSVLTEAEGSVVSAGG